MDASPTQGVVRSGRVRRIRQTRPFHCRQLQPAHSLVVFFCLLWNQIAAGAMLREDFSSDPLQRGWQIFGDSSLFQWNSAAQVLAVTWDSSHTNSFFHLPLGRMLSTADDFSFAFDLRLQDIRAGSTPGKSNEFEIAVGLINRATATKTNSFRGAGQSPNYGVQNVVEFDYFPDAGFGDTLATTVISTNNRIFPAHNFPLTLRAGDWHRFTITYSAADQTVRTTATRNGMPFGMPPQNTLGSVSLADRPDFQVDAFSVTSYSDAVQVGPPAFQGSVLAHGAVDNIELSLPDSPVRDLRLRRGSEGWETVFEGVAGWTFALRRSLDLHGWEIIATTNNPAAGTVILVDTNSSAPGAFYFIEASRP